jgi:hypothetical protein
MLTPGIRLRLNNHVSSNAGHLVEEPSIPALLQTLKKNLPQHTIIRRRITGPSSSVQLIAVKHCRVDGPFRLSRKPDTLKEFSDMMTLMNDKRSALTILVLCCLTACSEDIQKPDAGTSFDGSIADKGTQLDSGGIYDAQSACSMPVPRFTYLMAFHSCEQPCQGPHNHVSYLAGSNDGISWTHIEAFVGLKGSVPDIVAHENSLYLFHTGEKNWARLNACYEVLEEGRADLQSATDTGGFVDPSLLIDNGELVLFYLPGIMGQDPAGCATYPCTKEIHSARSSISPIAFSQSAGNRTEHTLETGGTFSDPDIIRHADGYLLYVSTGQNTAVFSSNTLEGEFKSPDHPQLRQVSQQNSGGVPSAISVGDDVWLYVSTPKEIRRAVIKGGITAAQPQDFETVLTGQVFSGASTDTVVSSPSIIVSPWPK